MKAGGERVITIPSKLGYGAKGIGDDIPPDSDLVFEVTSETKGSPNDRDGTLANPTPLIRKRRLDGGLIVSDVLLGTGVPVKPEKRISLHYTRLLRSTGKVFDRNNSKQHPLIFRQGTGEVRSYEVRKKCSIMH